MSGLSAVFDERKVELRRFLLARTGNEADADDLVSELWIKLQSVPDGPIGNPASYLFKMANNMVLDRRREARRRERRESDWSDVHHGAAPTGIELSDPAQNAEGSLIARDEAARLRTAVEQLPDGARRVLRMHKFEELSHGEVAERLDLMAVGRGVNRQRRPAATPSDT